MKFLPEQLNGLEGLPFIASIVWLLLIIFIPLSIILIKPIKALLKQKTSRNKKIDNTIINNMERIREEKGFKRKN